MLFRHKHLSISTFVAAVLANVLLGTNAVATKFALETMDPLFFASARFMLVGLILLAFVKSFAYLKNPVVCLHLGIGSLLVLGFVALFAIGIDLSSALKASLLSLITPVTVYVLSVVVLREPIIVRALIGCLVALAGGLLLVGLPLVFGNPLALGDVLLLISFLLMAGVIVHGKYLFRWMEPVAVVSLRFLLAGVVLLVGLLLWSGPGIVIGGDAGAWMALGYATVVAGAIGLALYYTSLGNMRGEQAAPLFYLDPVTGMLAAGLLLGESIGPAALIGALIVVAGVAISHPYHGHVMHRYHIHRPHLLEFLRRHHPRFPRKRKSLLG